MSTTKRPPSSAHNRTFSADAAIRRFSVARIRGALFEVVGALRCRPSDKWDVLVRPDADVRESWTSRDVEWCREALAAAAAEGPLALAQTGHRIERFFAEKVSAALDGYDTSSPDFRASLLNTTRENADLLVAVADALHDETEGKIETVRLEAMEAEAACEEVITLCSRKLAEHRPTALAAHR